MSGYNSISEIIEESKLYHQAARQREIHDAPTIQKMEQSYAAFALDSIGRISKLSEMKEGNMVNIDPLEDALIDILSKAAQYCGTVTNDEDLAFMAQEGAIDLRRRFSYLHLAEIEEACRLGRAGEFGKVFGVNAKSMIEWVDGYIENGWHAKYLDLHTPLVPLVKRLTDELSETKGARANANVLEDKYNKYIAMKRSAELRDKVLAAKADAAANNKEYVDLPVSEDDGKVGGLDLSAFNVRGEDGKRKRSIHHPLWDHDGHVYNDERGSYVGTYARTLNELGYPGKDLQEIFEWMIAHDVTTLKDKFGFLKRRDEK